MRTVLLGLYALSVASMVVFSFVWPVAVSADPDDPILRIGCLASLGGFLVALVGLLWTRPGARARRAAADR